MAANCEDIGGVSAVDNGGRRLDTVQRQAKRDAEILLLGGRGDLNGVSGSRKRDHVSDGSAGRGFRLAVIAVVAVDPIDIPCAGEHWRRNHHQSAENRDNGAIQHGDSSPKNLLETIAHVLIRNLLFDAKNGIDSTLISPAPTMCYGRVPDQ